MIRVLILVSTLFLASSYRFSPVNSKSSQSIRPVDVLQDGMKMKTLPRTDITVSELCLGTMMFGEHVSKIEAFSQLDAATKEYGINFVDTAESYPAPSSPGRAGHAEAMIGEYLSKRGNSRSDLVISTKICGFSDEITWVRKGEVGTRVTKQQVFEAVDAQLNRLNTDYIDLLQIHWPERYVPLWGAPTYEIGMERSDDVVSFKEQIEIMDELVKKGKIRAWGVSNETPYGMTKFVTIAEMLGLTPPVVTQNAYNLLVRNDFEIGMLETCAPANSDIGLLAYSPLAGGALTGKYSNPEQVHENARMREYVGFMHRYISPPALSAIDAYAKVAESFDLPLQTVAQAFVYSRPFVASTIIGASSLRQLKENVMALNLPITQEMENKLNEVYKQYMDPTKGVFDVIDPNIEHVDASKLPWGGKDQDVDPELDMLINQRQF